MSDTTAPRVFFAAPLFGIHERAFARPLAAGIQRFWPELEIILPQNLKHQARYTDFRAYTEIFKYCLRGVETSSAIVALLDGADADSGVAFLAGHAHAKGIPIVGVRTDYRQSQEMGLNLMLSRACASLVYRPVFDEDIDSLAREVHRELRKVTVRAIPRSRPARMSSAKLTSAKMSSVKLPAARLSSSKLPAARLSSSMLPAARMSSARLAATRSADASSQQQPPPPAAQ